MGKTNPSAELNLKFVADESDVQIALKDILSNLSSVQKASVIDFKLKNINGVKNFNQAILNLDENLGNLKTSTSTTMKQFGESMSQSTSQSVKEIGVMYDKTSDFIKQFNILSTGNNIDTMVEDSKKLAKALKANLEMFGKSFDMDKFLNLGSSQEKLDMLAQGILTFTNTWNNFAELSVRNSDEIKAGLNGIGSAAQGAASGIDELKNKAAGITKEINKLRTAFNDIGKGKTLTVSESKDEKSFLTDAFSRMKSSQQILDNDSSSLEEKRKAIVDLVYAVNDLNKAFNTMSSKDIRQIIGIDGLSEVEEVINTFKQKYRADVKGILDDMQKTSEDLGKEIETLEVAPQVDINPQPDPDGEKKVKKVVEQSVPDKTEISVGTEIKTDDEDIDILKQENGLLEEKLERLRDIAEEYGNQITQRDRNRYEELNNKENESGLTDKESDRYWELGEKISEADQALEEFGATYDRIILKLSNGKEIKILPDDAGLRALEKIANEYSDGEYNGFEIEDVQFERVEQHLGVEIPAAGKAISEIDKLNQLIGLQLSGKDFAKEYNEIFEKVKDGSLTAEQALEQIRQKEEEIAAAAKKREETQKKANEEGSKLSKDDTPPDDSNASDTVNKTKDAVNDKTDAFKNESEAVKGYINEEIEDLNKLENHIRDNIILAINAKTQAFEDEKTNLDSYITEEIQSLGRLETELNTVADKAKIGIEVEGNIGDSNNSNASNITTDNQDIALEDKHNQELQEKAKIYQRLKSLIEETLELRRKLSGEPGIMPEYDDNGKLLHENYISDIGFTNNRVAKTNIAKQIQQVKSLSAAKQPKMIIEEAKNKLAAYVATYENLDEAKEAFGNKEKRLWNDIIQRINLAKIAKEEYEKIKLNQQFMRESATDLIKLYTDNSSIDQNKLDAFLNNDSHHAFAHLSEEFKIKFEPEIESGAILEEVRKNTGNTPIPVEIEPTVDNPSNSTPPITTKTEIQDLNQLKAAIIEVEREIALKTRAFNEESVTVTNVVSSELILLEKLKKKIEDIKTAVNEKTSAFTSEQSTVTSVVDAEVLKLKDLSDKLAEIKNNAQSVKLTTPAVDIDNTKQTESAQEKLKGLLQELRTNGVTKGIDESTERTKKQIAQLIIQLEKYGVALDSILSKKDLTTLNAKKWGINDVITDLKTPATDSIGQEIELVGKLKTAVDVVESAVRNKNKAFSDEQTVVKNAVDAEIQDLKRLEDELGIVAEATNIKNTVLGTESSDNKKANSKKNTTQNKSNASPSTLSSVLVGIDGALSNLSSAIGTLNGKVGMDDRNITVDGISGIGTNVQNIYNILNNQQQQDVNLAKSINSAVEELRKASQGIAEDIQEKKTANEKDAATKKKTYVREADPQMEAIQGVINTTKRKYNAFSGSNEVNGELKNDYLELIELINKARISEEKLSEDGAKKIEDKCRAIQKEIDLREQNIIAQQKEATQEELAKKYEEKQKALQKSLDDISINGQADTDDLDKAKKKVAEIEKEIEKLRQKDDNDQIKILDNNELAESKENLKELTSEATKLINTVVKDYNKTAFSDTYSEQLRKAQNAFKEFKAIVGNEQLSSDIVTQVKNYEAALKELEAVQQRLANKPASQLTTDDKTAWENAKKTVDEYEKSLGKLAKTYQEVQNAQEKNSIDKIAPDIDTNNPQQMFDALSKYAEAGVKARVSIGKLNKDGKSLNATFVDSNHKLQQITVTYDEFTRTVGKSITPMKKVETQWDKLVFSIGRKMREMVAYMASFVSVYEVFNVIRQGVTYVKEIDDALTELKKVTDETDASYNKFLQDMSKTAAVIGTTVKDLTSSAADWARLGLTKYFSPIM